MKQILTIAVLAAAVIAAAAEGLKGNFEKKSNWWYGTYKLENGAWTIFHKGDLPGWKTGISNLVEAEKGKYYVFTATYTVTSEVKAGDRIRLTYADGGKVFQASEVPAVTGKKSVITLVAQSTTGEMKNARLSIQGEGKSDFSIVLSGMTMKVFDFSKPYVLPSDGDIADVWQSNNRKDPVKLAWVPCEDHIDGGKALEITPDKKRMDLRSRAFPLKPETRYRMSCFFKADKAVVIESGVSTWYNRCGYGAAMKKESVASTWKKLSAEFKTPSVAEKSCLECGYGEAYIRFNAAGDGKVYAKDWTIEEVK